MQPICWRSRIFLVHTSCKKDIPPILYLVPRLIRSLQGGKLLDDKLGAVHDEEFSVQEIIVPKLNGNFGFFLNDHP